MSNDIQRGWIAVDLDGTLALYNDASGIEVIGPPIQKMLMRVQRWLAEGSDVRIFTARVYPLPLIEVDDNLDTIFSTDRENFARIQAIKIREWCHFHLGKSLPITCQKDYMMAQLWDDRCVQVIPNTGIRADGVFHA